MINTEGMVTIIIAVMGMLASWAVWVSVSVFKHAQEIALIKQEIKILSEVKDVLEEIKFEMKFKNGHDSKGDYHDRD